MHSPGSVAAQVELDGRGRPLRIATRERIDQEVEPLEVIREHLREP